MWPWWNNPFVVSLIEVCEAVSNHLPLIADVCVEPTKWCTNKLNARRVKKIEVHNKVETIASALHNNYANKTERKRELVYTTDGLLVKSMFEVQDRVVRYVHERSRKT